MTADPSSKPSVSVHLAIREDQCIACAVCADVCPSAALAFGGQDMVPSWMSSRCNGCRICARECPTQAISVQISTHSAPSVK
ncbi:MAG: 4Fe-4S binding protein [Chthonomonadales bacterium]